VLIEINLAYSVNNMNPTDKLVGEILGYVTLKHAIHIATISLQTQGLRHKDDKRVGSEFHLKN
jgi:hypothetical protein